MQAIANDIESSFVAIESEQEVGKLSTDSDLVIDKPPNLWVTEPTTDFYLKIVFLDKEI